MPIARIIVVKDGKSVTVDLVKEEVIPMSSEHFAAEELIAFLRPLLLNFLDVKESDFHPVSEEKSDAASSR
jgi:hypothetical protein